ncbi:MAG: hypothetical protein CVV27_16360 [Candidatus Melainabacteria bacterium HGW-Melainabacteria-1]|nr:MAG: hypothetical protein CVV27_16360 [Candidatus Melainabacteria bacterium HGW-Melainabacteria-1]
MGQNVSAGDSPAAENSPDFPDLWPICQTCLQRLEAGFGQDPGLTREILQRLRDLARLEPASPEPQLALAWFVWLLGYPERTGVYLSQVQSLIPEHAEALSLQHLLATAPAAETLRAVPVPGFLDDEDAFVQELLKLRISQALKQFPQQKPNWMSLSNDLTRIDRLDRLYAVLNASHVSLQALLAEGGHDSLRKLKMPLQVALSRCRDILSQTWQLQELRQVLDQHKNWLEQEENRFLDSGESLPAQFSLERFDTLLEDCAQLAGQLEHLAADGYEVSALYDDYEAMTGKVSRILDLLEKY